MYLKYTYVEEKREKMSCPKNISSELSHLKKQFLCCTPAKEMMWNDDLLHKLYNSSDSLAYQKLLLENTVNQSLVKKFGLKLTYQQSFIKYIINKLESSEKEVLDELYNTYCKLLNDSSNDTDTHYRHFILDCHGIDCITLKESFKVISQGTTGLCSWQASLALADWCLHNYQYFYGKCVLELGSGVGLTGLVVSLCCHPSSYWFSDCHPSVLHMLQSNIILNTNKKNIADENSNCDINETSEENIHHELCICGKKNEKNPCCQSSVVYRTEYNGTKIGVLDLPWENIPSNEVTQHISPDLVLAADVVFDSRLFKALCQAFCHLLKKPCSILLGCTVRNEDTLKSFMDMLRSEGLKIYEEQLLPPNCILYSNVVPVKLYRILGHNTLFCFHLLQKQMMLMKTYFHIWTRMPYIQQYLFNSFNGAVKPYEVHKYDCQNFKLRCRMTDKTDHISFWDCMKDKVRNWNFLKHQNASSPPKIYTRRMPSYDGWLTSINAI